MANLYVTELERLAEDQEQRVIPVAKMPGTNQVVAFTTSAQSSAFATKTKFIRIQADAGCFVAFGSNPTATTSDIPLTADTPEYFAVDAGDKIAAYDGTS